MIDGDGEPVDDALVEIWQANRHGRYRHPEDTREELPLEDGFTGFGRCPTDAEGRFEFVTVKPGAADGQAPHISVCVFARGLLRHLYTRIYFPDEAEANAADPLLSSIEDEARRATLIARPLDGVLPSTSTCRASARPHSLTFDSIFVPGRPRGRRRRRRVAARDARG